MNLDLPAIFLGFVVSVLVTMTGVGAGCLMAPALSFGLGLPASIVVGTDLLYAAIARTSAFFFHAWNGRVKWRITGVMLLGSIPATLLSLGVLRGLRNQPGELNRLSSQAIAVALGASGVAILATEWLKSRAKVHRGEPPSKELAPAGYQVAVLVATGALVGLSVSLSSVGAGSIVMAVLLIAFPAIETRSLVGTDLAYASVLAIVAGTGHLIIGSVNLALAANLILGMLPGVYLGGRLVSLIPESPLRKAIAVMLMGVSLRSFV